ncbi:hypothetical protein [Salinarimonas soli]|uniref:Uncharacterized protein n=1 Tax=Salinarimonas soli TaxID=1638099 RepID=A0A5B2VGS2_9HYPH|nr:hypothetical protein [Salinarimonas soli]KAA2237710.1 hypothetical protein F0L46_08510 [Salinarimonas soli]
MGRFSTRSRYDVGLAEVVELAITCEDCGKASTWNSQRIRHEYDRGFRTVPQVWQRLYCSYCKNRERSQGRNIQIKPKLRSRGRIKPENGHGQE